MKRRTYLSGAATALGLSALAVGNRGQEGVSAALNGDREPAYTLLEGTRYATEVYVIDAPNSGPTAVVVGGMHGDERSGALAAGEITDWAFDAGRVVVLPRANRPALERGTRHGINGDLNRAFPSDKEPTTKLAQAIWNDVVQQHDPDFLLDLHSSAGIYKYHYGFNGQAIYPTAAGDAPSNAGTTVTYLNETFVPWYMPFHDFKRGNIMDGSSPLLAHKVGGDLGQPAYIVETAEFLTDTGTRVRWTTGAAQKLLSLHEINRQTGSNQ